MSIFFYKTFSWIPLFLPCYLDPGVWPMSISWDNTSIKICVLVILAIFWIAHHRGHLCLTNTSCWFLDSNIFPAAFFSFPINVSAWYYACILGTVQRLIRDSSDSNSRFYIVTCAGQNHSGLHIEKLKFSAPAGVDDLPTFYNLIRGSFFQDRRIKSSDYYSTSKS